MSLMDKVKGFFSGDATAPEPVSKNLHVIDTTHLHESNGGPRPSPRDQFLLLQKLARFAEREKLNICAVLEGRPLREAADNEDFNGVRVVYAERADQLAEIVMQQVKRGGRDSVVITGDRQVEMLATQQNITTLRSSTFRKALDERDNGGRNHSHARGGERGGDRGGERGGDRNRRRRRPRPPRRPDDEKSTGENTREPSSNAPGENSPRSQPQRQPSRDDVSDLIDLV